MFGKSTATRLQETAAFVRGNATLNATYRAKAADYIEDYVNKHPGEAATLSNALHIGENFPDPQNFRPSRRAYVLLYTLIAKEFAAALQGLPAGAIAISGIVAKTNLPAVVKLAAIHRDQQSMSNVMAKEALDSLRTAPLQFLSTNKVVVSGSTVRDTAQGDENSLQFYFRYNLNDGRYVFSPAAEPGAASIMADSVVARWWTDIPGSYVKGPNPNTALGNFSNLEGIKLKSQIMVTTQFTGCAFAMKRAGGHMYCAHTTPRPPMTGFTDVVRPMTGNQLAQEIRQLNGVQGGFQNVPGGPDLAIYGAGWSYGTLNNVSYPNGLSGGSYMTILGFPNGAVGGDYSIFSQVTQAKVITSFQQIF